MSALKCIFVVPAADKDGANAYTVSDMGAEGDTFTVGLSPTGLEPATHYWCDWLVLDPYTANIPALEIGYNVLTYAASVYTPQQVLDENGLKVLYIYTDPNP